MTIMEMLEEKCRKEGRKEGQLTTLRNLLRAKFGPEAEALDARYEARLKKATPKALDRYAVRVLTAESLPAVFEESR